MSNAPKITQYFHRVVPGIQNDHVQNADLEEANVVSSESESECENLTVEEALQKLTMITDISHRFSHERKLQFMSKYEFVRFLAIENYVTILTKQTGKIEASVEVASTHLLRRNATSQGLKIRLWADHLLAHQELPLHRQGCHVKTPSLVNDKDVSTACRKWLQYQRPDLICGACFANCIRYDFYIILSLHNPVQTSDRTAVRWMDE